MTDKPQSPSPDSAAANAALTAARQARSQGLFAPLHRATDQQAMVDDLDFMREVDAAWLRKPRLSACLMTWVIAVMILCFLVWAAWTDIDEVTRAQGFVAGSQRIQSISNLEGGILREICVKEGEIVQKGMSLAYLDNEMAKSAYRDAVYKSLEHRLALERLDAELQERSPQFTLDSHALWKEVTQRSPDADMEQRLQEIIEDQKNIHAVRHHKLATELTILEEQQQQRTEETRELMSRKRYLERSITLLEEQRNTAYALLQRRNYSRMEFLALEQRLIQAKGDNAALDASIPKALAAEKEAKQRIASKIAEEKAKIIEEINKRRVSLNSLRETLSAGEDRATRTELSSPVRGTVQQIHVHTIGGVVKPGEAIMTIVPLGNTLLVEARVRPQDIAFLRPKQKVTIKVTAYDFAVYGGLAGELESISADTVEDKKGEVFYIVKIRTKESGLRHSGDVLPVIPGMVVSAEIITGKKTILDYIMNPIMRTLHSSLSER